MPYLTPNAPPDDTVCRTLRIPNDVFWLSIVDGALSELTKDFRFEAYGDYSPEDTAARFRDMYDDFVSQGCEMACCYDVVEHRVTSGGEMQVRVNGGDWQTDPNDPRKTGISLPPPVMDATHTKCDAATNGRQHFEDYIAGVSSELGGTTNVYVLALALAALIVALFFGQVEAIPPIAAFIITALPALIGLGQAAWDAYWTSDELDVILCALFCNMGDDGQLDEAGFSAFKAYLVTNLTPGVAADALLAQIDAIGLVGVNNMCAYGSSADADCSGCPCTGSCDLDNWDVLTGFGDIFGVITSRNPSTGELVIETTGVNTNGLYYIDMSISQNHDPGLGCFCNSNITGSFALQGEAHSNTFGHSGSMLNQCVNHVQVSASAPFSLTFSFGECP